MSRPADPPTFGARLVLASGLTLGLGSLVSVHLERPHMLAANFEVYHVASEAALAGEGFYDVAPDRFPHFYYLYPPVTILTFFPFALLNLRVAFLAHTLLEVGIGLAFAAVLIGWIGRHRALATVDRLLIAGFVVASVHTVPSLYYGQVNLRMAALVGVGLYLLERGTLEGPDRRCCRPDGPESGGTPSGSIPTREGVLAGVALAGGALIKVFPAAVGLWLLVRRAWTAVGTALATGLGGLAVGAVVFGRETTRTYFLEVLLPEGDAGAFVGGLDPANPYLTVRRPLSVLLPGLDPVGMTVLAALVLAPALAYVYTDFREPVDRLVAAHATLVSILLYFPSYPLYYVLAFGTLVPTLYLLRDGPSRRLLVAGAVLANVVLTLETVEPLASATPDPLAGALWAVVAPTLTLLTPQLLGCLVMLAGCVRHRYRRSR